MKKIAKQKSSIMKKSIILFIILFISCLLHAEVSKKLNLLPGRLSTSLTTEEKNTITSLTIIGSIDARDFRTMRDAMPLLAEIDLSGVSIEAYSGIYGTTPNYNYPAKTMPESSFYSPYTYTSKTTLTSIKLPFLVYTIGKNAFYGCTGLLSVSLSSYLISIEESAFENCQSLSSMIFTSSLNVISKKTFKSCVGLTSINIPSSVTSIGESAFENCKNLSSVLIPSTVTSIEKMAFKSCENLTSVILPAALSTLGESAFENCTGLTSVNLPASLNVIQYGTFRSCESLFSVNIPASTTIIGEEAFADCHSLTNLNIPSSVVDIGVNAFEKCYSLTSISIPSSVRVLGAGAFSYCENINTVSLPNSINIIDDYTFYSCVKLQAINIPSSVIIIDYKAFYNCPGLKKINIPSSVIALNESSFEECTGLTSIKIPSSVKKIGRKTFSYCNNLDTIYSYSPQPVDLLSSEFVFFFIDKLKTKLHVPFGAKEKYALADQWKDFNNIVEMPGLFLSDHSIGMNPDAGNTSILIASSVEWSASADQSWLSINPVSGEPGTTSLTITAFPNISNSNRVSAITFTSPGLTESQTITVTQYSKVEITPGNLKTVLTGRLSTITHLKLSGTMDARDFKTIRDDMPSLLSTDLSEVSVVAYSGDEGPSPYASDYPANAIPEYAFGASYYNLSNTNLCSLILPPTITEIGIHAFNSCTGLLKLIIPPSVTIIGFDLNRNGYNPFVKCSAFIEVDEKNQNYSSSEGVLFNKSKSNLIHCPVSKVGNYAVPSSVVVIENYAFYECNFLTSVYLPPSVYSIGDANFNSCQRIKYINIPSSVTIIGDYSFSFCRELESVVSFLPVPLYFDNSAIHFDVESTTILYVPFGTKALYQNASQWNWFMNIIEMTGMNISVDTIKIGASEGSTAMVDLASNVAWSVMSDQTWLKINPHNGTGNSKLTLTANFNPIKITRQAIVTVASPGSESKSIIVIQDAKQNDFQLISFTSGWNIFSAYAIPTDQELKAIAWPLITVGSLLKIQDETGNSLEDMGVFGGWTNNIGNISLTEGYKIKVNKDCQLSLSGAPAVFPNKIPLKAGWNIIGYPRSAEAEAKAVVQQLIDRRSLVKVQDEKGNSIEDMGVFGGWTNYIGNFKPGEGYKVKMNVKDTLIIYESYSKSLNVQPQALATGHFQRVGEGNGMDHMNINLVELPLTLLQPGDEIGVFDGDICVGAVVLVSENLENKSVSIPVSASDETGSPGFTEGGLISLSLWKALTNKTFTVHPKIISGTPTFVKNESSFFGLDKLAISGLDALISPSEPELKIFPNPTNGKIMISAGNISLKGSKVQVITLLGQVILDRIISSDTGEITISGNVDGMYYLKVSGDNWSITEKVILKR
jgi:hypothetical protein